MPRLHMCIIWVKPYMLNKELFLAVQFCRELCLVIQGPFESGHLLHN